MEDTYGTLELAQEHLGQHPSRLVRVANIFKRIGSIASGFFQQDLVASGVLRSAGTQITILHAI